ncbi:MAG: hypothetical protein JWM53_2946 [bacterium]|nr:hypothetical protein [bacterium]
MAFIDSKVRPGKHLVGWRSLAGKQKWQTCSTLAIARKVKLAVENQISVGRDWNPKQTRVEADLIKEVGKLYLEEHAPPVRKRPTIRRYGLDLTMFERFLRQHHPRGLLGVTLLSKDTLTDFATWLRRAENGLHGRKRGEDAVRKIVETIEVFWAWAYEREKWDGVPLPKRLKIRRSPAQPPRAPTWAEMDAAVNAANGWHKKLMIWMRYTGMRVTESMMVLWSDVDLDRGTLSVRRELDGNKTGVWRIVPLSPHLIEEIATWGKREGYVIPSERRKGARERQARTREINTAWRNAGVPEHKWKRQPDNAFRKGVKTGLVVMGLQREAIDYVQGHIDAAARARYVDPSQLPLRAIVDAIPRIGTVDANVVKLPTPAAQAAH